MAAARVSSAEVFALFPLRLGLALVFIYTGWEKFADLTGTRNLFDAWGIPLPAAAAFLVALAELGGGLGILVGVLPRFSAATLAIVMVGAMFIVRIPGPFFDGWAFEMVLVVACVTIVINGAGRPTLASVLDDPRLDLESMVLARLAGRRSPPGARRE